MTNCLSRQESDLIGRIYDCALEPSHWKAALEALRSLLACTTVRLALVDLRNYSVFIQNTLCVYARPVESASKQTPEITQFIEKQLANGLSMDEPMVTSRFVSTSKSCPYLLDDANPQGIVDFAQIVLMRTPTHISLLGFD